MRRKLVLNLLLLCLFLTTATLAQRQRITGKVTSPSNTSISGVSVTISGTTQGSVTDADGMYSIVAALQDSLLFSAIGYSNQTVAIAGRSEVSIVLSLGQANALDEVVITGYTAQKRKDITGSVAVVDTKALKSVPSGSAMQALQGQAAGVNIINNGSPGSRSNIFIRGISGFSTDPLVLIDGIQGDINDIPASDVESIQVLKDAGAASIYGARGSNGVIVITTRKGKSGQPSVVYDSYYNMQFPYKGDKLDLLSAQEYAAIYAQVNPATSLFPNGVLPDYLWRSPTTRGIANEGDAVVNPALYNFDPLNSNNNYIIQKVNKGQTNMWDAVFKPALMMNQNITASGANDKANYLMSLGYLDQNGTLENTNLRRYSIRVNTQYKIRSNIRIGENLYGLYKMNPQVEYSANHPFNSINSAKQYLPFLPVYDIAGNYGGTFAGPNELGSWGNSKANRDLTDNNRNRTYSVVGNLYLEVDFFKHLTARTSVGGLLNNFYNQQFDPKPYWNSEGYNNNNRLTETSGYNTTLQWTNNLTYRQQFGKHNLTVLAGTESVENKARNQRASGQNFFSTSYNYLILSNAVIQDPSASSAAEDALFSIFGRVDYNFAEKYLLGLTVRRDGFSAFGKDKKYGVFPAVSLGWRLSQEEFMKSITWINDLKLRGSYGVMGNKEGISPINAYTTFAQGPTRSYYAIGGGNDLVQGFYPSTIGNTFTSWERDKVTNVGLDASLFKNKFDLSVEWYKKAIDGLLRPVQLAATAGEATPPFVNIGNIENTGVDINATYRVRASKDFQFSISANLTTYKNIIKSIPDPGYFDEGQIRYEEGHPMSSFFGYEVLGVFKDQKDVDDWAVQDGKEPGRFKYRDVDGNDTINSLDRTHFGDANPDFTLGVNLSASYKNFDFSAILYTSQGNDIYNGSREWLDNWIRAVGNKSKRVLNAWTPENPNTSVPKNEVAPSFSNVTVTNSYLKEDGSFIRLRSVQLGYTIPAASMRRLGISRLRVYAQGTNLFLITKYSGLDPEVSSNGSGFRGLDFGAYPQEKGFTLGLNVAF